MTSCYNSFVGSTDPFNQLLFAQAQNLSAFGNEIQLQINSVCVRKKAVKVGGNDTHLSGVQVMRHLQHQEENTQGLLLDGVSLPGFHDLPAQRQERMNLLQLTLHQQQLQTRRVYQQCFHAGHMTRKAIQTSICRCIVERANTDTHHAFAQQEERSVKIKFNH